MVCAACNRAITSSYYLANERTLCGLCRNDLERAMNSGSGVGRFARATGAGLVAAFLGFLLYYGIARLTGYEFGLIAIVVGFGVGSAVRWGSNGRGGWAYQGLAMALTYLPLSRRTFRRCWRPSLARRRRRPSSWRPRVQIQRRIRGAHQNQRPSGDEEGPGERPQRGSGRLRRQHERSNHRRRLRHVRGDRQGSSLRHCTRTRRRREAHAEVRAHRDATRTPHLAVRARAEFQRREDDVDAGLTSCSGRGGDGDNGVTTEERRQRRRDGVR
jgi:hypothetical protein